MEDYILRLENFARLGMLRLRTVTVVQAAESADLTGGNSLWSKDFLYHIGGAMTHKELSRYPRGGNSPVIS